MNEIVVVLQARMGSSRLPGKIMMNLLGRPMLAWQIESLARLNIPIVIATSNSDKDDCVVDLASESGLVCVRGSETNVLERFQTAIERLPAKHYVRVTGDCPLISPRVIHMLINLHLNSRSDYSSNTLIRSFPDGLDVEMFTTDAFSELNQMELNQYQREHVTPGFYENPDKFKLMNLLERRNLGHWRWTIDYASDFDWLKSIMQAMKASTAPEYEDLLNFIAVNPKFCRTKEDVRNVS